MKAKYILIAMAALAVSSCAQKPELPQDDELILHAWQEGADGTRTTVIDGGTQVYWEPSDVIQVFCNGKKANFTAQNEDLATVADFKGGKTELGIVVGTGTSKIWGLYPSRTDATCDGEALTTTLVASQMGRAGSFAKNTHITVASSDSYNLSFFNVCGGLRFSLSQSGVKNVVLKGNEEEELAGTITVEFDGGVPVITNVTAARTSITLNAPDGTFEPGAWYYIEALPGSLASGFTMTFNKDDNTRAVLVNNNPATFTRGIYGSLSNVDSGLSFEPIPVTTTLLAAWRCDNQDYAMSHSPHWNYRVYKDNGDENAPASQQPEGYGIANPEDGAPEGTYFSWKSGHKKDGEVAASGYDWSKFIYIVAPEGHYAVKHTGEGDGFIFVVPGQTLKAGQTVVLDAALALGSDRAPKNWVAKFRTSSTDDWKTATDWTIGASETTFETKSGATAHWSSNKLKTYTAEGQFQVTYTLPEDVNNAYLHIHLCAADGETQSGKGILTSATMRLIPLFGSEQPGPRISVTSAD